MVNATIDNSPVFVLLEGGQSTTVPQNEVWKVSIHLSNPTSGTTMKINGLSPSFNAQKESTGQLGNYLDVVLVGGTTIEELFAGQFAGILISGFIVKS